MVTIIPLVFLQKILTAVMNYVMHDENHSSDDVITHSNLFSQSINHLTHIFTPAMNPEIDDVIIDSDLFATSMPVF